MVQVEVLIHEKEKGGVGAEANDKCRLRTRERRVDVLNGEG